MEEPRVVPFDINPDGAKIRIKAEFTSHQTTLILGRGAVTKADEELTAEKAKVVGFKQAELDTSVKYYAVLQKMEAKAIAKSDLSAKAGVITQVCDKVAIDYVGLPDLDTEIIPISDALKIKAQAEIT